MAVEFSHNIGKCPACKAEGVNLKEVGGLHICEKCASKRFSSKVRKSIEEAYDRQQDQRRREQWKARMDIAKRGVRLFEEGKLPEALKLFRDYLAILESKHAVAPGGLHPSMFMKADQGEILLIAGVYWDLAKVYDHMKGHVPEMRAAINKFIEFSIDRQHVILASEAVRKYLISDKVVHVEDFKNAHVLLRKHLTRCFIATAVFGPVSYEVRIFRSFRDDILKKSNWGRLFIREYYRYSPRVAELLIKSPRAAASVRFILRGLSRIIDIYADTSAKRAK